MIEETIVLVHGLWMNGIDMTLLINRMKGHGYRTERFSYPSMGSTPRENAARLDSFCASINTPVVHFIGHSLGGIVIRHLFFDYPNRKPGRVVTLGTPHRPSYSAHNLSGYTLGKLMLGHSVIDGLLGNIPPWSGVHDLGSIAGTLQLGLGRVFKGLPSPNDGTVSVEETRLQNMKDHVTVKTSHFGLLLSPTTARLCHNFLRNGSFGPV
jgi:pimeloyl-ACP methyl ester carboxylesterase